MLKQGYKFFKGLVDRLTKLKMNTDSTAHSILTGAYNDSKINYDEYYSLVLYYTKNK